MLGDEDRRNRLLTLAGRLPGGGPEAVQEVIGSAASGEELACRALDDIARWIAVGLRAVINVFNPEMVVFGDFLALVWQSRAAQISTQLAQLPLVAPSDQLEVVASKFGLDAPLVGAAELAFTGLLADPASIAP